jgi:hypothetical protein
MKIESESTSEKEVFFIQGEFPRAELGFLAKFILSKTEGLEMTMGDELFPCVSFRTPEGGEKSLLRLS